MSSSSSSTVLLLLLLLSRSPVTISSSFLLSLLRSITRSLIIFTPSAYLHFTSLQITSFHHHYVPIVRSPVVTHSLLSRVRSSFAHLIHLFHSLTYSLSRFLSFISLTHYCSMIL